MENEKKPQKKRKWLRIVLRIFVVLLCLASFALNIFLLYIGFILFYTDATSSVAFSFFGQKICDNIVLESDAKQEFGTGGRYTIKVQEMPTWCSKTPEGNVFSP